MEADKKIKVSVIIPVYNVEKYLKRCIESVLAQDYSQYEIILVDDGSTDSSGKMCDEYESIYSQIRVIHQENKGVGGARNTGVENSKGEYILFVDSDDYIESITLSTLVKKAEDNDADLVVFNMRTVTDEGKIIRKTNLSLPDGVFNIDGCKELFFATISAWSKLYKSTIFKCNNIKFPDRYWFEDVWIAFDVFLSAKRVVRCDDILYNYVMRGGSIMNSKNITRSLEIIKAFDNVKKNMQSKNVWEKYHDEIEYVAINNIYIGTSIRILLYDTKSKYMDDIRKYMDDNYQLFYKNKYLSKIEKLMCFLLRKKMYALVKIMTLLKRRLEGYVLK